MTVDGIYWRHRTKTGRICYRRRTHGFDMFRTRQIYWNTLFSVIPLDFSNDLFHTFWGKILVGDIIQTFGGKLDSKFYSAGFLLEELYTQLPTVQQQHKIWREFKYYWTYYKTLYLAPGYEKRKQLGDLLCNSILQLISGVDIMSLVTDLLPAIERISRIEEE